MNAVLADTGPLFAAADPEDQYHGRAQEEARALGRSGVSVIVAWPTILESYTLVIRYLGPMIAHVWLPEVLDGTEQITPTVQDYSTAASAVRAYRDQRITLFDALIAGLSRRLGLSVWTYDHHFDVMRAPVWRS